MARVRSNAEVLHPSFNQPKWMSGGCTQCRCVVRVAFVRQRRQFLCLTQQSVHEWGSRAFTSSFGKFNTFKNGGSRWNAFEVTHLEQSKAQGREHFKIEAIELLRGNGSQSCI